MRRRRYKICPRQTKKTDEAKRKMELIKNMYKWYSPFTRKFSDQNGVSFQINFSILLIFCKTYKNAYFLPWKSFIHTTVKL